MIATAIAIKLESARPGLLPPAARRSRQQQLPADQVPLDVRRRRAAQGGDRRAQRSRRRRHVQDPRVTRASPESAASSAASRSTSCRSSSTSCRGEMSLVGPRPLIFPETAALEEHWHLRRLELRPGMTGPWQVYGRSREPLPGDGPLRLPVRGRLVAGARHRDPPRHASSGSLRPWRVLSADRRRPHHCASSTSSRRSAAACSRWSRTLAGRLAEAGESVRSPTGGARRRRRRCAEQVAPAVELYALRGSVVAPPSRCAPDVTCATWWGPGARRRPPPLLLRRRRRRDHPGSARIPIVYTPHGYSFTMGDQGRLRRLAYRAIERSTARRVSLVGAVSDAEARGRPRGRPSLKGGRGQQRHPAAR